MDIRIWLLVVCLFKFRMEIVDKWEVKGNGILKQIFGAIPRKDRRHTNIRTTRNTPTSKAAKKAG